MIKKSSSWFKGRKKSHLLQRVNWAELIYLLKEKKKKKKTLQNQKILRNLLLVCCQSVSQPTARSEGRSVPASQSVSQTVWQSRLTTTLCALIIIRQTHSGITGERYHLSCGAEGKHCGKDWWWWWQLPASIRVRVPFSAVHHHHHHYCCKLMAQHSSHRAPLHSTSGRVQSVTVVFFLVENSSDDSTSSLEQCFVCAPSFTPEFPYSQLVSYSVSQCRPHSNLSLFSSLTSEAAQQQQRSTKPPAALQLQYFCTAMPLLPFR